MPRKIHHHGEKEEESVEGSDALREGVAAENASTFRAALLRQRALATYGFKMLAATKRDGSNELALLIAEYAAAPSGATHLAEKYSDLASVPPENILAAVLSAVADRWDPADFYTGYKDPSVDGIVGEALEAAIYAIAEAGEEE